VKKEGCVARGRSFTLPSSLQSTGILVSLNKHENKGNEDQVTYMCMYMSMHQNLNLGGIVLGPGRVVLVPWCLQGQRLPVGGGMELPC
jgi:hypothetical protein